MIIPGFALVAFPEAVESSKRLPGNVTYNDNWLTGIILDSQIWIYTLQNWIEFYLDDGLPL
jgi:hypothetical protein